MSQKSDICKKLLCCKKPFWESKRCKISWIFFKFLLTAFVLPFLFSPYSFFCLGCYLSPPFVWIGGEDDIGLPFKSHSRTSSICCFFPWINFHWPKKISIICSNCSVIGMLSMVIAKIYAVSIATENFIPPICTYQGPKGPSKLLQICSASDKS